MKTQHAELRILTMALIALLAVGLSGCGSSGTQTRYLHPNADLGAITKVAVLPFDSLSTDKASADKVEKIFYLELLSLQVFEVAEPGQVTKALRSAPTDAMGPADYQKIGKDLGVDGVFVGSVVDFSEARTGTVSTPEVTIQLRLIETSTGSTIWSTGQTRSGAGMSTRLFGVGGESLTEAARRMVREELSTLLK